MGNDEADQAEAAASSCKRKAHFFLGSNNKRAKTVVLHIDGLDDPVSAPILKKKNNKIKKPCLRSFGAGSAVAGALLSVQLSGACPGTWTDGDEGVGL